MLSFSFCAHAEDVEEWHRILSHKTMLQVQICGQKPRLETGQRVKYLTQARGCEGILSWAVLMWVRGSQGDSRWEGTLAGHCCSPASWSEQNQPVCHLPLPFPRSAPSGWPWGADCLPADTARSLQSHIPVGAAACFSRQGEPVLGCWGTHRARVRGAFSACLECFTTSVKLLCKTPVVFNTEGQTRRIPFY